MASTVWYAWMKGKVLPEERKKREKKKKKKAKGKANQVEIKRGVKMSVEK